MIVDGSDGVLLRPKTIDNSGVVREVDRRSSRDLWWLLLLAGRARRQPRAVRMAAPRAPPDGDRAPTAWRESATA